MKNSENTRCCTQIAINAVDLFCGAGGLTCGLQKAGIRVKAGVDSDPACEYAFSANNDAEFIGKSVEDLSPAETLVKLNGSEYTLLCGCAPCQTFSSINQKASREDSRWGLLLQFGRLVKECEPDFVAMENVPGLEGKDVFCSFCDILEELEYDYSYSVVDCTDYGIPQRRRRLVLLASRHGHIAILPKGDYGVAPSTVREAIGALPVLKAGHCDLDDPLHFSSALSERNLERIRSSQPGGTWKSWDASLRLPCHEQETGDGYGAVYGRMEWDKAAPTITTQFYNYGSGRFGHPDQDRAISFREGALLQTFPEDYAFYDPKGKMGRRELGRLIGNAVPVRLGEVIGLSIMRHALGLRASSGEEGVSTLL